MKSIEQKYNEWLDRVTDDEVRKGLEKLANDEKAKANAFYKDLEFGTAGLRGEIGAGTNALNVYTIRKVTQGIADCMKDKGWKTACVSCDSRINSDLFMFTTAEVFACNGIKTFITKELMPTPFLSYITREMKADIGVMITASHNPAKYNGYKVYGADGCQLTDASALEMTGYIEKVDGFAVCSEKIDTYLKNGVVEYISDEVINRYLDTVFEHRTAFAEGLKVTYSALNGTGYKLVPAILKRMKVASLDLVSEQCYPDGNFTTCPYPNPEKKDALMLGIEQAKKNGSDILIATDPDADRVGTAVMHNGEMQLLTGNHIGVLLSDYLLARKKEMGVLPEKPIIVKTIVTTELVKKVAGQYGAEVKDVLTGFKYIGDVIAKLEKAGEKDRYVLGFEERYGYLTGTYVRDKDAVNASMLIAEMTAYYKKKGVTLVDKLNEIYDKFGLYEHKLCSYEFPGVEGNDKMKQILASIRANMPSEIAGVKVIKSIDYLTQTEDDLPKANVLSFFMEDGSQMVIRPSGTEPLVKTYLTSALDKERNEVRFSQMLEYLAEIFK